MREWEVKWAQAVASFGPIIAEMSGGAAFRAVSIEEDPVNSPRPLCPYLDRRDTRCASLLTLTHLQEAFRLCAGNHEFCTIYHQIRTEDLRIQCRRPVAQPA